jgi:hypothetical protein
MKKFIVRAGRPGRQRRISFRPGNGFARWYSEGIFRGRWLPRHSVGRTLVAPGGTR